MRGNALRLPLADRSVDLVFGSPPYVDARLYLEGGKNLGIARGVEAWVAWMLRVTEECLRVSRGPVVWVAAGKTKDRTYWPACEGLMWEWSRRKVPSGVWQDGIELPGGSGSAYRPCYWHRVGIPGSGGDQWFRADVEYAMCFKRPGKLPWTDNTAMGHPPKWAPGGDMSHRLSDGTKVNQWGKAGDKTRVSSRADGTTYSGPALKSHVVMTKEHTKRDPDSEMRDQTYTPPVLANPGNLIKTAVGGGQMGSRLAHENEAPFPEALAEFFLRSLCEPSGTVLDPFSGSGTTAKVAEKFGRRGIGLDLRQSQCLLGARRIREDAEAAKPKPPRPKREPKPRDIPGQTFMF